MSGVNQKTVRLDASHLRILDRINRNVPFEVTKNGNPAMIRFKRDRTFYNIALLNELKSAGYVSNDNKITVNGYLLLMWNS